MSMGSTFSSVPLQSACGRDIQSEGRIAYSILSWHQAMCNFAVIRETIRVSSEPHLELTVSLNITNPLQGGLYLSGDGVMQTL